MAERSAVTASHNTQQTPSRPDGNAKIVLVYTPERYVKAAAVVLQNLKREQDAAKGKSG